MKRVSIRILDIFRKFFIIFSLILDLRFNSVYFLHITDLTTNDTDKHKRFKYYIKEYLKTFRSMGKPERFDQNDKCPVIIFFSDVLQLRTISAGKRAKILTESGNVPSDAISFVHADRFCALFRAHRLLPGYRPLR